MWQSWIVTIAQVLFSSDVFFAVAVVIAKAPLKFPSVIDNTSIKEELSSQISVWVKQYNDRKKKFSVGVKQYLRENSLFLRNSKTEPWALPTSISSLCIVSQIGQLQMLFSYE